MQIEEQELPESDKIGHVACEKCGSKDNAAVYTDGHTYCFGCQAYDTGGEEDIAAAQSHHKRPTELIDGYYTALTKRGITEETCRKFDYQVTDSYRGRPQQIANYRNAEGLVIAQKIRDADKNFSILGEAKKMVLFGQHLWNSGRKLVITEGELDCMSVSQVQGNKWPVVSLGQGVIQINLLQLELRWECLVILNLLIQVMKQNMHTLNFIVKMELHYHL